MTCAKGPLPVSVLWRREMGVMSFSGLPCRLAAMLSTLLVLSSVGSMSTARAADPPPVFEIQDFTARALDAEGNDDTVAGGHPHEGLTSFSFRTISSPEGTVSAEPPKSTFVELPPGFLGNLANVPRCPLSKLA